MASSELRRHCDTELSLGRRRPAPACANNPCGGLTVTATELQAMAILRVARRAVALEEGPARRVAVGGDGADSRRRRLSVRRSLELFLRQRREARCQQQLFAAGAAASPSSSSASSSSSCFTDSDS